MVNFPGVMNRVTDCRDNPDGEDIQYPPPQPLDGEIDRMMETDHHDNFVLQSDGALQDHETVVQSTKHPASEPASSRADEGDDVEDLGSEDEEEEEEEDGDISLEEEELDEEEDIEGEEDEEMQDADVAADEDTTMQSIENNGVSAHAVAQTS